MAPKSKTLSTVAEGNVVAVYYTLTDDDGNTLDTNKGQERPLIFLQGAGNIVPGLDKGLLGAKRGSTVKLSVAPEDGYGAIDEEKNERVPREKFPAGADIQPGMVFTARTPDGLQQHLRVGAVEGDEVIIDHNHPLAGKTLHFEIYIYGIREATDEEREHKHAHGPGGHQH